MSDTPNDTPGQVEWEPTLPYIMVEVAYIDGKYEDINCPLPVSAKHFTHQENAFINGLVTIGGWFTVLDVRQVFHAISLDQIKSITCRLVE